MKLGCCTRTMTTLGVSLLIVHTYDITCINYARVGVMWFLRGKVDLLSFLLEIYFLVKSKKVDYFSCEVYMTSCLSLISILL